MKRRFSIIPALSRVRLLEHEIASRLSELDNVGLDEDEFDTSERITRSLEFELKLAREELKRIEKLNRDGGVRRTRCQGQRAACVGSPCFRHYCRLRLTHPGDHRCICSFRWPRGNAVEVQREMERRRAANRPLPPDIVKWLKEHTK